jgi:amidophosphoribosyltransferase
VDDTLVRATTLKTVVEDLRGRGGVKEVHVRIGNPPIMGPCFYGIDMPTIGELFAPAFLNGRQNGEVPTDKLDTMAAAIGADSLIYLSNERLIKAVALPKKDLCMACLTTEYPTPVGQQRYEQACEAAKTQPGNSA